MSGPEDDGPEAEGDAPVENGVSAADPQAGATVSVEQLESLRRERDELKDQLLRRRAEFENYRRRVERERTQAREEAAAQLVKAIIPVLDNFERAMAVNSGEQVLREGLELTRRDLLRVLEAEGVRAESPLGEPFDPERHQALSHEQVPGQGEGVVVEVFRKGYVLGARLLRPALVKVSRGPDVALPDGSGPEAVH
jgi:molecular chaperone GrpE